MRIVSVDPGATSIGLAKSDGKSILLTANLRLVPQHSTYPEWKKKHGSRTEGLLIDNLLAFLKSSEWGDHFLTANLVIFEGNTFTFSHALCFALVAWLKINDAIATVHFVFPANVSKLYKIGGLSRHERKNKIRGLVFERCPRLKSEWSSGDVSQDELDAVLNIFYFQERKKKKDLIPQCPHWSCTSLNLTRP